MNLDFCYYLSVAVKDGKNIETRTKLAWADTEAGG